MRWAHAGQEGARQNGATESNRAAGFANQRRRPCRLVVQLYPCEGKSPLDAVREACLPRFRAIMMTTMAALVGGLSLALGRDMGSELRRPLGIAIVEGLIVSQLLTLFTTPVTYLYLDRLRWRARKRRGAAALSPAAR